MEIKPIAYIQTQFPEKFGVPRQSGLARALKGRIVFEPEYRNPDALRGLDGFSHIWLIWEFSANRSTSSWQPTVRPPRLGGNAHMGVFATRSPFRPNPLGLSCVKVDSIDLSTPDGPVINVFGADLMDGTPIYDIKPYIKYADARPEAICGYVDDLEECSLKVVFPSELSAKITDSEMIPALVETLRLSFAGYNIRFYVFGNVLEVSDVSPIE